MNHMARVWTAGAIEYIEVRKVDDLPGFLRKYTGRKIATMVDPDAEHLSGFKFEPADLIIMGVYSGQRKDRLSKHFCQPGYLTLRRRYPNQKLMVQYVQPSGRLSNSIRAS